MPQTFPSPHKIKAERVAGFGTTVFTVWSQLAREHQAINLGQGFPDFAPPAFVMVGLKNQLDGYQQYSFLAGMPTLREALAEQYQRDWGRAVDPATEVTVTVGATEGIYATIQALIDPGDEVVLMEPFYDSYPASVTMAGGVCRYVPLRPDDEGSWYLDMDEFRSVVSPNTRMLVLNTPNNPTGKCFTREELQAIADVCIENDVLVLADEVYDHLLFDGREHCSIATLDGMWERTITLSSVGKTFSVTGWKIGWAITSPALTDALQMGLQWVRFSVATPLQLASAEAIQASATNGYYDELTASYQGKRDFLVDALKAAGLRPLIPEGTYFVIADTSDWGFENDESFCRHLVTEVGVVAIPPSHFYSPEHRHLAHHLARFAFCKKDEVLEEAASRLRNAR
ncbi:MAG: aminotransferase class I/II-fold pyridoxal phosphate-dependent enzyme [Deltaproteobacteria bacterium]|nr:MAG: aminotransferase class I/II-fold pyridoxal phosphate-dependent enzyme [Deltaproteobacteria bacterium]